MEEDTYIYKYEDARYVVFVYQAARVEFVLLSLSATNPRPEDTPMLV
jgi:hypothetical protein